MTSRCVPSTTMSPAPHASWRAPVVLEGLRGCGVGANRQEWHLHAEQPGQHGWSNAHGCHRLPGGVHGADDPSDLGMDNASRSRHGEIGEVLGGAEATRQDHGVEFRRIDPGDVGDASPGDACRLDQDVPPFARCHLAGEVVDNMELVDVGRHAHGFDASAIEREQRDDGFMDLGAVEDATTGKDHADSRSWHVQPPAQHPS